MPNYLRPRVPGAAVFFTVALAQRGSWALVENVGALREAVRVTRDERPFGIEAWVVLPDHLHCVWKLPEGDADYATRWRLIKSRFSRALPMGERRASHIARQERGLWQRRYWEHHIRNDADYASHVEYCWWNPVKHGFVQTPADWPHSSWHRDRRVRDFTHRWHAGLRCLCIGGGGVVRRGGACEHAPYGCYLASIVRRGQQSSNCR